MNHPTYAVFNPLPRISPFSGGWGGKGFNFNTLKDYPTDPWPHCLTPHQTIPRIALACLLTLLWILGAAVAVRAQDLAADKKALVALYNATNGANWDDNTNWLDDTVPLSEWYGVTVTNGRVQYLNLNGNRLTGSIPAELGNTNLQGLYLDDNQLTGSIPSQLGNLANLKGLSLSNNRLTGSIPAELGNTNLNFLDLPRNQLTGSIPTQLGNLTNLDKLTLYNNQLTGSIPSQLGNLAYLKRLYLSGNQLTGSIPASLGNLTNLLQLWLQGNQLKGTVPATLGNLTNLEDLLLSGNQLTGPLPKNLTNLTSLDILWFDNGTTGLCAPTDPAFQNWLQGIPRRDGGPNCISAGQYSIPGKMTLTYPKAGSGLDDLISRVASDEISAEDAAAEAPLHRGDAIAVTVHLSGNVNAVVSFLENNGVTPRNRGSDYIEAFVPIRLLGTLSQQTGVLRMRMIQPPQEHQIQNNVPGNGPPVHGSPAWNAAGYDGSGVRVGVIDGGFSGIRGLLGTELPPTEKVWARCYRYANDSSPTTNLTDCETGGSHGTVVAESILDIAPDVELFISQPRSYGDLSDAVRWMTDQGVDVINHSMGWFFDGPGDGTSPSNVSPLKAVDLAVNRGIVWVNAAGNDARTTWFKRAPFSSYVVNFEGLDSTNGFFLRRDWGVRVQLRWDDNWGGATRDLDLCIGDAATGAILKCTGDPQTGGAGDTPFEVLRFWAPSTGQYDLVVVRRGGAEPGWIQLTMWGPALEHFTEHGSITNPGESTSPGMLTVGAARWSNVNVIESYSSQGPLPDGRIKPDVVGAACGETETSNRGFCGTSQSSPHVAGMAALVRQRFPRATPAQVATYLKEYAEQRVPSPDPNNIWGHGFAVLPPISQYSMSCTNGITVPNPLSNLGLVRDCEALLEVKGRAQLNWLPDNPITMWQGIGLAGSPQRVTVLNLRNSQLAGAIHPKLGKLDTLLVLDLSDNRLADRIPPELGNLANLQELSLNDNQLTGTIPTQLGNLANLDVLKLSGNQMNGTIPSQLGKLSNLTLLWLHRNQLTGLIPTQLGNLANLRQLSLSHNQLRGNIPAEVGNLANLWKLSLNVNQLTGAIPSQLGNLANLQELYLHDNQLTGPIPTELGRLANLTELWLSHNQLTGTIPQSFLQLAALERIFFQENTGLCAQDDAAIQTWLSGLDAAVGPDCALSSLFVPVILSASGRNNSFFTSELALTNRGSQPATLLYTYTAHAGGGSGEVSETVAAGRQMIVPDAIEHLRSLGIPVPPSGNRIGTLRVAVSGSPEVGVTVRTTTRVADGRAGLAYPGIAVADGFEEPVYLSGLRQNAQDRSNVAFQNMGASGDGNLTLRTTVFSGDPAAPGSHVMPDVTLPPGGFHQYSGLLATAGIAQGYVKVERVSGTAPFYAYGVINDQANSDGSFVFPVTAGSLAGVQGQTLPVMIEHPNFTSELIVTNFSNAIKALDVDFVADAIGTPDKTASVTDDLIPPGAQAIIPDAVQMLRESGAQGIGPRGRTIAGAAFFTAPVGDLSGVVIGARTGSPGGGGQYSVFYNAVPYGAAFDTNAWVDALQHNRENRSNLALVNTGEADGSDSVFELEIYNGDTGQLVNTVTGIRVPARGWHQINGILGNYAPSTTQGYVRVRKTAGNNPFLAYGVVNDGGAPGQRSDDGAYLPAAREQGQAGP